MLTVLTGQLISDLVPQLCSSVHPSAHPLVLSSVLPSGLPPDPAPAPPPGNAATAINKVVSYIKWGAGTSLIACFFAGLIAYAGGRVWDHHRAGRMGTTMILCSLFGGLLYGTGYTLLSTFAGG